MYSTAEFSSDKKYRYVLTRAWGKPEERFGLGKMCAFVGLNPSTADETKNDPTIRRCMRFAKDWGYQGIYMLNIFAFRSTDPFKLRYVDDPIGGQNDYYLRAITRISNISVCGWGNHGILSDRGSKAMAFLERPYYLALNKNGTPKHPLYLKSNLKPKEWQD